MTVSTTRITAGPYDGNDTDVEFSFGFPIISEEEISISETDATGVTTVLILNTDYTIQVNQSSVGGTITRLDGPLPQDHSLYIRSNVEATQKTDFESQGNFFPDIHENAFDKLTLLILQLKESLMHTLRLSDDVSAEDIPSISSLTPGEILVVSDDGSSIDSVPLDQAGVITEVITETITEVITPIQSVQPSMLNYDSQFGADTQHYLSNNALIVNGDSITQGANGGSYIENGWAYKIRRQLMEAYSSTSYGYLSVSDKNGYIDAPAGAYRWYEPSTTGVERNNEDAPNSIGGTEVELASGQDINFLFNRDDFYIAELIPQQRRYRIVFNDSSGSVRVTAQGIGFSIDTVVDTVGTGISDVLNMPQSWLGEINIAHESGTPIINGIVLMSSEDDYCVHHIYNGGRSMIEINDSVFSQIITGADLYIHALGVNDTFGVTTEDGYNAKIDAMVSAINASRRTTTLLLDFGWVTDRSHFMREGLKRAHEEIVGSVSLLEIPQLLANGGDEYTPQELNDASFRFLSSDGVHPFINGHNAIAGWVANALGLSSDINFELTGAEEREAALERHRTVGYNFHQADLSKLVVGWISDGTNSVDYTENVGTTFTGRIANSRINTMIPIYSGQRYAIEIDFENVSSTGIHGFGTRSMDRLGGEIFEQDSIGSVSGNLAVTGLDVPIGERRTIRFVVGGHNDTAGTDASKFEPNAAFFDLAITLNNGDTSGEVIIHGLAISTAQGSYTESSQTAFANGFSGDLNARLDSNGVVRFDNSISSTTAGSGARALTITSGFRPPMNIDLPIYDGNLNLARMRIEAGGAVRFFGDGTAGWADFDLRAINYIT